jgi:hypothetical protein
VTTPVLVEGGRGGWRTAHERRHLVPWAQEAERIGVPPPHPRRRRASRFLTGSLRRPDERLAHSLGLVRIHDDVELAPVGMAHGAHDHEHVSAPFRAPAAGLDHDGDGRLVVRRFSICLAPSQKKIAHRLDTSTMFGQLSSSTNRATVAVRRPSLGGPIFGRQFAVRAHGVVPMMLRNHVHAANVSPPLL